jgi:hypothetical protein
MVSRLFTKGASGVAKKLLKPKPKTKATTATGTGLSKPTVKKNKNKREYEANMAKMGGGQKVGSDAGRKTAMKGRELQDAWQGLTKGDQRYERTLGKKSKFYSIIKKLDTKPKRKPTSETPIDTSNFGDVSKAGRLKAGGKVMKRKAGGKVSDTENAKPKDKPTPPIDKGAVERGNRMSKMEADSAKAMNNKMGGGQVMKYKKGGMVYKKHGGVVKAASGGDSLIASCYD